jgi:cyclopropane fatty-acyl-phospholipid synthase-like methyltransferase
LQHQRYQRSNNYDPAWVAKNQMGPNALWLTEFLTEALPIEPGMKVLDLGCGMAMSSIFLAKEFGAQVWAGDLWIEAADNQKRIVDAGVEDLVTPLNVEAHTLPFAKGTFDAIISIDAYQYFGTADLYLGYLVDFLKPSGRIGAVMPSLTSEVGDEVPERLAPFWEWDFCCFHTAPWWQTHWAKTGKVTVDVADVVPDGWKDWLHFNDFIAPSVEGWWVEDVKQTHDMLEADRGENLQFVRIVGTKVDPKRPSGASGF